MNAAHIRMSDTPHILVVDDDREIRTLLRDYLEKNGFKATAVADGQETRRALERTRYDLIVLDLMLPHESGLEICRELRTRSDIPIVMLTALGEEVDRIVGLEVGADDYLAKPFSPRELLGRIRAVLRRTLAPRLLEPNDVRAYTFAGWNLARRRRARPCRSAAPSFVCSRSCSRTRRASSRARSSWSSCAAVISIRSTAASTCA